MWSYLRIQVVTYTYAFVDMCTQIYEYTFEIYKLIPVILQINSLLWY
jgi:hypothetical protein